MSDDLDEVMAERSRLVALGYRMLGSVQEAEDAVQETYLRWYRLGEQERAAIDTPQAWLTRVASRVCLDVLKSARVRREQYVGPWLPEPVPADLLLVSSHAPDPADRVTLDDTVSTALLVVLDAMTPPERVAFVLHDVFAVPFGEIADVVGRSPAAVRQLASSARRRVATHRESVAAAPEHDAIVRAFGAAAAGGDLGALAALLDPSVVLRSDGGGLVSAALKPVSGPSKVARFVLGCIDKRPTWRMVERPTADGLGFVWLEGEDVLGVINLQVADGLVTDVWMVVNPDKLATWRN
ncbi:RNA polymerase subunit sigma-24 [Nocardioides sp. Root190]|uniref:RNA polymerase sigma factor SigJ n=1 Tax=Nocardioides sp. Root190 TaxID=1736488 RepID=UPI0006FC576B|nr:RNA polymerase sigma factor SigJ [Nocardioides sp. Root190]KRB78254.1 RNA polymerase subunit sigma-24 [Nocardioides sp. Root190]